jgi:hypothetical protein
MSSESANKVKETKSTESVLARMGAAGFFKLAVAGVVCLSAIFFYTMLPIAGLQLLPFLFFGCVCMVVGIADDLGLYR